MGCQHLLAPQGHYLAMKGVISEQELQGVATVCVVAKVEELVVPGLTEQRHLIKLVHRSTDE